MTVGWSGFGQSVVAAAVLSAGLLAPMGHGSHASAQTLALRAATVHVGDGTSIENGIVLIENGRVSAVGADLPIPAGTRVIYVAEGAITPGLIDASARVEPKDLFPPRPFGALGRLIHPQGEDCMACAAGRPCNMLSVHLAHSEEVTCPMCALPEEAPGWLASGLVGEGAASESSSEVVPNTLVIDGLNLRSQDLDWLASGGVTTVFAAPDTTSVIGPRGAVIRTAGPVRDRVVRESADVQAAIGSDPFRLGARNAPPFRGFVNERTRRPTTRMGVEWVLRKALHDTRRWLEGRPVTGSDAPSEPAMQVLSGVLSGEIPLRVHARMLHDIETARRIAAEFGVRFTLVEATESYKCAPVLASEQIPVIYGPIYIDPSGPRARTWESRDVRLTTLRELLDAGVTVALTAQDLRGEDGLVRQGMYAVRAGVSPAEVLPLITSVPARLLGIDSEVGTLEVGKRADVVVWSGEPFEAGSKALVVVSGGEMVMDLRESARRGAREAGR